MIYRTQYQRGMAACELLQDLEMRAVNEVVREVSRLARYLISAPPHERAAIEPRVVELVKQATERRSRLFPPPI